MPNTTDPRIDRLYRLLPAIYRMRDAEKKYPLQALLRVISEQVNVVEDDISQLYENWFIETCQDWAVPYVADLIGYRPVAEAGPPGNLKTATGDALNRVLVPRREVANTIRYRRRKGTLALLETLANDVAGWPARAVEVFKLLGWTQNINHTHIQRARLVDVREMDSLDLIDGPFDRTAHTVDVRRIDSHRTKGRHNIPTVGVFVWRLKPYSITEAPAYCAESAGPHCYTFSVLGQDAPLFIHPEPETDPTHIAKEMNVPAPIRRLSFDAYKERYYGPDRSIVIWAEGWPNIDSVQPVPASAILPADLSNWQYTTPRDHIAVDPVLGRFAFPPGQLPRKGVRVTYHYAFSDDMGGGEYTRTILEPSPRIIDGLSVDPHFYRVGRNEKLHRIADALDQWKQDAPADAVIEITDSGVYVEPIYIELGENQSMQLRASSGKRPTIRLLDWRTDLPDALSISMSRGSRMTIDGLLITGRAVHFTKRDVPGVAEEIPERVCASDIVIRHSTLVPGWGIDCDCQPMRPAEPSLEIYNVQARLMIEHSIIGSIQIHQNEVTMDPIPVTVSDSILDASAPDKEAIGSPGSAFAHATMTIRRSAFFGIVGVHAMALAEDSIFMDCVHVARRQIGCMRFCYVPAGCRTPRRYRCQPDLVVTAVKDEISDLARRAAAIANEKLRVTPQFTARRYGLPGYGQLGLDCAVEIRRGAESTSEMGVFHNLYQPQREANLAARLDEFTPAGMEAGIVFET